MDVFMPEECDAVFVSGAYEENFMDVIFDPEEMISQFEADAPLETITKRPPLPEEMTPWDRRRA